MVQSFKERAKEMDYSNLYYPYADVGPKKMKRIQNFVITIVILMIIGIICSVISSQLAYKPIKEIVEPAIEANNGKADNFVQSLIFAITDPEKSTFNNPLSSNFDWEGGFKSLLNGIAFIMYLFSSIFGFVVFILIINYLINVVRRNQEFERNVIVNDMKAVALYRKLMSSLKIKKRLSEAIKTAYPKNKGSGSDSQTPSADNISKVEELKYMKKLRIQVNTRQKLSSNKISTMYSIFIDLPLDDMTAQNLLKRVEKLNNTLTRLAKGAIAIGEYQMTEDRQQIIFQGETPDIEDPYNYDERLANLNKTEVVEETYESAYSITNLVDRQKTIDEKRELASEWAAKTGNMLDRYLITAGMNVTRLDTVVSSSKAAYTYDLALDSKLSGNVQKFEDALDKAFKLKGSSTSFAGGHLEVILPIPKDYNIPINVPTLYRQAFGEGVVVK